MTKRAAKRREAPS
jgi:hypothetical protein